MKFKPSHKWLWSTILVVLVAVGVVAIELRSWTTDISSTGNLSIYLLVVLASFCVQRLVEIFGNPIGIFFIRRLNGVDAQQTTPTKALLGFSELELRTAGNALISFVIGLYVAFSFHIGLLDSLAKLPNQNASIPSQPLFNLLDVFITGLIIGAGTNGANSLLKIVESWARKPVLAGSSFMGVDSDSSNSSVERELPYNLHPLLTTSAMSHTWETKSHYQPIYIDYEIQKCSNWCGPAVARMVLSAYGQPGLPTQAELYRKMHNSKDPTCSSCPNGVDCSKFNVAADLLQDFSKALGDNYVGALTSKLKPQKINQYVNGGDRTPLIAYLHLQQSQGHVVTIIGIEDEDSGESATVYLADPEATRGTISCFYGTLSSYITAHGTKGEWTATILTKP